MSMPSKMRFPSRPLPCTATCDRRKLCALMPTDRALPFAGEVRCGNGLRAQARVGRCSHL
jgi:hypothetical protein